MVMWTGLSCEGLVYMMLDLSLLFDGRQAVNKGPSVRDEQQILWGENTLTPSC